MNRRTFGALALAAPCAAVARPEAVAATRQAGATRQTAEAPRSTDVAGTSLLPRDGAESLRQFMRLMSGTGGEHCLSCEGIVYGSVPGHVAQRLVGFRSALIIRVVEPTAGTFRSEQREAMHYADLDSGEVLAAFVNPYTGERVIPVGYVSPLNVYYFDLAGSYMQRPTDEPERGPKFDWRTDGEDVWVTESRFNTFPSGITEREFPRAYSGPERKSVDVLTYRTSVEDFVRDTPSVRAHVTIMSDAPWPFWLMQGRAPGGVLWQGFGRKYASFAALPAAFRTSTEHAFPGFLSDPWNFPEWEYGTAPQMRRLRAAGRI